MSDTDFHLEDKPFLVALLFMTPKVNFTGTVKEGKKVRFRFTPRNLCVEIIENFYAKTGDKVFAKDLFDGHQRFWNIIKTGKEAEGNDYGKID